MKYIDDDILIKSYNKAIALQLDEEFIQLLKEEIDRRGLKLVKSEAR